MRIEAHAFNDRDSKLAWPLMYFSVLVWPDGLMAGPLDAPLAGPHPLLLAGLLACLRGVLQALLLGFRSDFALCLSREVLNKKWVGHRISVVSRWGLGHSRV